MSSAPDAPPLRERATRALSLDYFAVLGVKRNASTEDIAKAYVEAAKIFHPDRSKDPELRPLLTKVFARLELAKSTLSDPARRARYIAELAKPAGGADGAEASLAFKKAEGLLKKNSLAEAEQHLRRAVQLAPGNGEYAALLAWVQAKPETPNARLTELVADLDRVLQKEPKLVKALFYRGQLRKRLGLAKEAFADFQAVVGLEPEHVDAAREVRLHKMRSGEKVEKTELPFDDSPESGGFFKKLFKKR